MVDYTSAKRRVCSHIYDVQIQKNGSSENFGGSRNFRSNVRISGRTFEIRKNVQIQKNRSSENFGGRVPYNLGSFKLSYVSPENDKIGKMGWWKLGRKSVVWGPKTGFQNFLLDEYECFEVDLQFGKVEKMR